ncbi:MAG: GGDEF domain-containing protein [Deltaproteobacteria bacterium]|nr:GGDEF domain-containing protein [Deltaproteobacteria bacterium]
MKDEDTRLGQRSVDDPPRHAALVVVVAPDRALLGTRVPLAGPCLVGRDPTCDLVLALDDVSRRHALVDAAGAGHLLTDLGSLNGTYVGEARVERRLLQAGEQIRIGSAVLKYVAAGDPEAAYHEELARRAHQDPLTGLANRAVFDAALERAAAACRRHGRPLALLLGDVDHFKAVNDGLGHAVGDEVLRELARLLGPLVRRDELLARVGGEELAVLLPEADLPAARAAAERIRAAVEAHRFGPEEVRVTLSLGVAVLGPEEEPAAMLTRADALLYEAKRSGRNCVRG